MKDSLVRSAHIQMNDTKKILTYKHNLLFLQLPAIKRITEDSPFLEKWAWYVSNIHTFEEKPEGLDGYFSLLFDCADRNNISRRKPHIPAGPVSEKGRFRLRTRILAVTYERKTAKAFISPEKIP